MPTSSSKEKDIHTSPSFLKTLGKKFLNAKKNEEPYHVIASGNSIAPLRKRTTSPHASTNAPGHVVHGHIPLPSPAPTTAASTITKKESESVASRHRSPSLVSRLRGTNKDTNNIHHVESSVSLADMTAHNTNPFIMTPLHDDNSTNNTNNVKEDRTLNKRATAGDIHRANTISIKKTAGGAHTHHLATPSRSKSFMGHSTNPVAGGGTNNTSNVFNYPAEKVVYNPYGINSRTGTAFGNEDNNADLSFYLHDGNAKIRMLPLPIEDPNKFLPEGMNQYSIHLVDNFIFDQDNKPIGSGGSSEVRKVRSAYRQKDVYALKKLNMIYSETPEKFYKRCAKEFIIAKYLSHNIHVMPTFLLLKVPTTTYTTRGWGFIMELGAKDLFELIERSGWKGVPISEKWCIFKQIAEGVKFCHDNGIAHRDLKPENVLISKDGICKLTDFGISDWYHTIPHDFTSPVKRCEGMIGSPPFTPPEVMYFDSKKHYPEKYQKPYDPVAMDMYALGIMLFTLINGIVPFIESCNTDARFREFETSYSNYITHQNPHFRDKNYYKPGPGGEFTLARKFKSTNGTRIAWRLSDPNPETRYTMEDLFNDPWFQAVETCVDPNEETTTKFPQIKNSSTNDGEVFPNDHGNSNDDLASTNSMVLNSPVAQHASNQILTDLSRRNTSRTNTPISALAANTHTPVATKTVQPTRVKPRSMVDIATSPILSTKNNAKNTHQSTKKSGSKSTNSETSLATGDSAALSRSSTATPVEREALSSVPETATVTDGSTCSAEITEVNESNKEEETKNEHINDNPASTGPTETPKHPIATPEAPINLDTLLDEPTPSHSVNNEPVEEKKKLDAIVTKNLNDLSLRSPSNNDSTDTGVNIAINTPVTAIPSTSSASSIKSAATPKKKKLVIHHHLDIPSSVTSGTSMTLRSLMSG
ncbi:serine/threonine-protein kinase Ptk2p/STK2 [Monosporozyma servazzii]